MIVVTGGDGFIGKNLVDRLRLLKDESVISLDTKTESLEFIYSWLSTNARAIDGIYHLGAITDTTEMNVAKFDEYNLNMSIFIWNLCSNFEIPLVYASSAATYGDGNLGFDDEMDISNLQPLNPYGWSKQQFDLFTEKENNIELFYPPFWAGLKFFNVYGYGEDHKGNMASMVFHSFNQVINHEEIKLFKSHKSDYKDGEQLRDFIYVDDVVDVCIYMMEEKPARGIYNVGTGKSRSFNDLASAVFKSLNTEKNITYFDTPLNLREQYQYFTQATTNKLRNIGYNKSFTELEDGVDRYCKQLLQRKLGLD